MVARLPPAGPSGTPWEDASSVEFEVREVATLGPVGTDAEHEARRIAPVLHLCGSFPDAMLYALRNGVHALVPAGYIDVVQGVVADSWVALHFNYDGRMQILRTWHQPTKPMCLAMRRDLEIATQEGLRLALHPATAAFAERFMPDAQHLTVRSKPRAVELAAHGDAEACIGSVDVVERYANLRVVQVFAPVMVWCLYGPT